MFKKEYDYRKLKECAEIQRGKRVTRKDLSEEYKYPVYQNSLIPLGNFNNYNIENNYTFVITAGAAGDVGYSKEKFWCADDCVTIKTLDYNQRYLYYFLLVNQSKIYKQVRKASIPRLSKDVLGNLSIPIISLEEQQRIVDILDKFDAYCNDLTQGLPAEIEARQKQYEYYRDKLLTFKPLED